MAFQSGGKPANTGAPGKTPAPVTKQSASDARSQAWGRQSYGANGSDSPSSVAAGKTITSPLADQLKSVGDNGVLDSAIAHGAAGDAANVQLRTDITDKAYPTSHGMRNRNSDANAKIPGALIDDQAEPVRQP